MGEHGRIFARDDCLRSARRPLARAAAGVALAALLGCSAPRETFDFSPAAQENVAVRVAGPALGVAVPSASALIDSNRLVIREENGGLAVLAGAQWADQLPRLVQARLVAELVASGVDAARPGGVVAYELATELRRFEIDSARQIAVVEITARLTSASGARRGAAEFVGEAPAPRTVGRDAVSALETALDAAAARLVAWTRKRV